MAIKDIPLSGKLIKGSDALMVGQNFTSLINMRYTKTNPRAVSGVTKINTTALDLTEAYRIKNAYQYIKNLPTYTSYILAQAWELEIEGQAPKRLGYNKTAIPNQGNFETTILHSDATGSVVGVFSDTPYDAVAYANGKEILVWGGEESVCSKFLVEDSAATHASGRQDYTELIQNILTDSNNVATIKDTTILIGSLLPLKSFKIYVANANTTNGTMTVKYWTGSAWAAVSTFVDGTLSGGKSLAQTGIVTFDDTIDIAKIKEIDSTHIFWYQVTFTAMNVATTVSHCTVNYTMQPIKDLWDGIYTTCISCKDSRLTPEFAPNVLNIDYVVDSATTFFDLTGFTSTSHITLGFTKRLQALYITLGSNNTTASVLTLSYWNGDAWAAVTNLIDNTLVGGDGLSQSGLITWTPPSETLEHKALLDLAVPVYIYKLTWSADLSTTVHVDQITGIPAASRIGNYHYVFQGQNRLWLCGKDETDKNSVRCSSAGTFAIMNGADSTEIFFGGDEPVIGGTSLYAQFGSDLYDLLIFFKERETWLLIGNSPSNWSKIKASSTIGCNSHLALINAQLDVGTLENLNNNVAIFQSPNGIYAFDGRNFLKLDGDVDVFFDPDSDVDDQINPDEIDRSTLFFDYTYQELHWCFASGTSNVSNREMVYSFKVKKWYEIDRGSAMSSLYGGLPVIDEKGNAYSYGFNASGFIWRLENGTSFNGGSIDCTLETGDIIFEETMQVQTALESWSLTALNKSTPIAVSLYLDSNATADLTYTIGIDEFKTGKRISSIVKNGDRTKRISYRFKLETSSTTEAPNFEPLILSCNYKKVRLSKN